MIPLYLSPVKAGFPSPAADYLEQALDFNELLVRNESSTYALRAQGDSMTGAGIQPGDILVVDRSLNAVSGSIVIASVYEEFTVKRLEIKDGNYFLVPENPGYPVLRITEEMDFTLWGVVTFVIHRIQL